MKKIFQSKISVNNIVNGFWKLYIVLVFGMEHLERFLPFLNVSFLLFAFFCVVTVIGIRDYKLKKECYVLILFCLVAFFSLFRAADFETGLTRLKTVLLLSSIPILFTTVKKKDSCEDCLKYIVIGSSIIAIMSLCNYSFNGSMIGASYNRLGDGIADSNAMGKNLALSSVILLHYAIQKKKGMYLFLTGIFALLMVLSQSKSAIVLFIFFGALIVFINREKISAWQKILIAMIACLILYIIVSYGLFDDYFKRFINMFNFLRTGVSTFDYSTYIRLELKKIGLSYIKQKLLFGYGIGQSTYLLNGDYFHDDFVQVTVETGIVGAILYYSLFFICLKKLIKAKNNLMIVVLLFLIFSGIFNCLYYTKSVYIILALCIQSCYSEEKDYTNLSDVN